MAGAGDLDGGGGDNTIIGTNSRDTGNAGGGDDLVIAKDGGDDARGSTGKDFIQGIRARSFGGGLPSPPQ